VGLKRPKMPAQETQFSSTGGLMTLRYACLIGLWFTPRPAKERAEGVRARLPLSGSRLFLAIRFLPLRPPVVKGRSGADPAQHILYNV
jgi:hypothetical protein